MNASQKKTNIFQSSIFREGLLVLWKVVSPFCFWKVEYWNARFCDIYLNTEVDTPQKTTLQGGKYGKKLGCKSYFWWKKSCTTWDGQNPIDNGIIIILGGAGFCPSTVSVLLKAIIEGLVVDWWNPPEMHTTASQWKFASTNQLCFAHWIFELSMHI